MMVIGIIMIVAAVIFMAGWYYLFSHLGIGPVFPFMPVQEISLENAQEMLDFQENMLAEQQLIALVETEEEARSIAEQYGIEFVSFSEGVAEYKTDENPNDVIARGESNGFPPLYLNMVRTIMKDSE